MKTIAERLKWARARAKYDKPVDAARAFGWKQSTYFGHENGDRNPSRPTAAKYAKAFRVSVGWLLENEGTPDPAPAITYVPLISWVSAGRLGDPGALIPLQDAPLLAFSDLGRGDFFALKVSGDSMDRISVDGSVIIVNRAETDLQRGKPFVFSIRGEATYKVWEPEPVPRLEPRSYNVAHQAHFIRNEEDLMVTGRVRRTIFDL